MLTDDTVAIIHPCNEDQNAANGLGQQEIDHEAQNVQDQNGNADIGPIGLGNNAPG
jgi:hypothetical protein